VGGEDFSSYYIATYPRIWGYLHRMLRDRSVASDLAQETFVRLLNARRETLPEQERTAYLFKIATNLARDQVKSLRREKWIEADVSGQETTERDPGTAMDLAAALEGLSVRERSMIWLAYVEGLDHRAIAGMVGVGEKSLKVLLFRIRRKLAAVLKEEAQ
jgi:RNA polymerase sigma-70 factor (ECF subfamily)